MPLLARDALRSEEAAEDHLEATAANIAMHPVTGTFATPHESAFAAHAFRLAFPVHTFLMALSLALIVWMALFSPPELQALWVRCPQIVCMTLGLVGRARLHVWRDSARSQRVGSWTWTTLLVVGLVADMGGVVASPTAACAEVLYSQYKAIAVTLAIALVNGTHGLGFVHKLALLALIVTDCVVKFAVCRDREAGILVGPMACGMAGVAALGAATAHMAEMHLRHSYAEKERTEVDKRQLKERNEQLQAEKERLMYDMLRRGQTIDDDSRSAIRRGLQARPNKPFSDTAPSEVGCPAPSDSPPPSLPPGAPSSTSSGYTASTRAEGGQQRLDSSGVALYTTWQSCTHKAHGIQSSRLSEPAASSGTGTGLGLELVTEALLREVMADEETLFELQTMLSRAEEGTTGRPTQEPNQGSQGFLPAQTNSGVNAACDGVAQQRVISPTRGMQRQDIDPFRGLASNFPVGPSSHVQESPASLGGSIAGGSCKPTRLEAVQADTMTPGQRALRVARQRIQTARADFEVCQVVRTLAIALGASRAETGTIKALHSVLLLLERPRMSCEEACASTGASRSNFAKWHRKVRHAQLDSPPPSWKRFHPRRPTRPIA